MEAIFSIYKWWWLPHSIHLHSGPTIIYQDIPEPVVVTKSLTASQKLHTHATSLLFEIFSVSHWIPCCKTWHGDNSLAHERCRSNFKSVFKLILRFDRLSTSYWSCLRRVPKNHIHDRLFIIWPGNGLVPSSIKPLPEPMLTKIRVSRPK